MVVFGKFAVVFLHACKACYKHHLACMQHFGFLHACNEIRAYMP